MGFPLIARYVTATHLGKGGSNDGKLNEGGREFSEMLYPDSHEVALEF